MNRAVSEILGDIEPYLSLGTLGGTKSALNKTHLCSWIGRCP